MPYQGQAGDFRLMSRRVTDTRPQRCPSGAASCAGMVAWVGFKQVPIEYRRAGRQAGGGASYPALFRLALEALTSFSDVPLNIATYVGALSATLSGLAGVVVLVLTLTGTLTASTTLWILVAVLFLGGVQLMSIGVLGRYLAHVHDQVLERPLYLVSRVVAEASRSPCSGREAPGPARGPALDLGLGRIRQSSEIAPGRVHARRCELGATRCGGRRAARARRAPAPG